MFTEEISTAREASREFTKLMQERPTCWGDNLIKVCDQLNDESEQMLFLQWLADPTGSTKRHKQPIKSEDVSGESFEDDSRFSIEQIPGKCRTFKVTYTEESQEDEKIDTD